jgi:hypothetical protein
MASLFGLEAGDHPQDRERRSAKPTVQAAMVVIGLRLGWNCAGHGSVSALQILADHRASGR